MTAHPTIALMHRKTKGATRLRNTQQKKTNELAFEVRILCRFWQEDGVWNGEAIDLPVIVFGDSFEATRDLLGEAVVGHLEALQKLGNERIMETIQRLKSKQMETERFVSLPSCQPFMSMPMAVRENEVFALC